ncbi:MAG: ASKHA domain-containing protein [Clostridiales Family XIII bacterium]|nr:ASKHA domain-containing protein [Clostridiales Family XIII bacterium]
MPSIRFLPEQKTVCAAPGTTIAEAARAAGVAIETPCNGALICGKCKVKLAPADLSRVDSSAGAHLTDDAEKAEGCVLACAATVHGDICVTIVNEGGVRAETQTVRDGRSFDAALAPAIGKDYLPERDETAVRTAGGALRGLEPGDTRDALYGLVADIGTTTLVTELVDLRTGRAMAARSSVNPQAAYGQDVLTRIGFASDPQGLATLHTLILREINAMTADLCEETGVRASRIYEIVLSGNTAMLHLVMGRDPAPLGRVPFVSRLAGGENFDAKESGFAISPFGLAYLPPLISAYVGADISSGVLAAQLHKREGRSLFVDIGTNGEMILAADGRLCAASAAAGPAFEGMNIKFGMRATAGAIEHFKTEDTGAFSVRAIGGAPPSGICGSGLIDIMGELVGNGVLDETGRFVSADALPPHFAARMTCEDGKPAFSVAKGVCLTQQDVRQVQLAKGALRAAVETLLKVLRTDADEIDRVLIAGSFGYHLRAENLIRIGLLPEAFAGKIEFLGNTSQSGGRAFLVNRYCREEMAALAARIEVVELANREDFNKLFIDCLGF